MKPLRILAALLSAVALASTMAATPGRAAPPDGALITVPAVQEWQPATGDGFVWGGGLAVVGDDEAVHGVAATFAEDLAELTGTTPSLTSGTGGPGDIVLALGDQGNGPESYSLEIAGSLTITGTTDHGVFNGTRTVLQLLTGADGAPVPAGTVEDWPTYEVRSVLMDNTPRHLSLQWWENFFKHMSYVKLNDTNLYIDGVGLDVEEMRRIDELAQKYYVKLVPQLNMPSHMNQLLPAHPEYQLVNQDGSLNATALDLTNPEAVEWTYDLLRKYLPVFSSDEWHLGSDEFPGWPGTGANHPQLDAYAKERFGPEATFADLFASYQNDANDIVKEHGKTMRVWNDMVRASSVVQLDPDVTVEYWIQHPDLPGLLSAADIAARGNPMVNAYIDHLYYDQSRRNLDPRDIYENFEPDNFAWETPVPQESVRGARVAVWLAWIYTSMESDAEVLNNIVGPMNALGQHLWGSDKLVDTYTEFLDVQETVGRAPGLLPDSENSIQPNPATARNADASVAYFARDAEGVLWTGRQSAPGVTHFSQNAVAQGIAGDPVVTTLDDGRLRVAARTADDKLFVATQDEPSSEAWTGEVLEVGTTQDPALVGDLAVVNDDGALGAVDLTDGSLTAVAGEAVGDPDLRIVGGVPHVASRTATGSLLAVGGGSWSLTAGGEELASDPTVEDSAGTPILLTVTADGALAVGSVAGDALVWSDIASEAVGQQFSEVDADGEVNVAVRTTANELVHAWLEDGTWRTGVVSGDVVGDPTFTYNDVQDPYFFAQKGRGTQLAAVPTGPGEYATNDLAESTVGLTAATLDSHNWPIYFVATSYGDLQTGTKWGNLWEWGRDFAIGTMAYPVDELAPGQFENVLFADDFEADSVADYELVQVSDEPAPEPAVADGVLSVEHDQRFFSTLVTDVPLAGSDSAVGATISQWSDTGGGEDTAFVGFVRDADNYSMMWVNHSANRIGFTTVSEGVQMYNAGAGDVPVVVEEGDRIAVTLTGHFMTGYVERNGVWHRVHVAPVNGSDDLNDPEVREQYRYAYALRGDSGRIAIDDAFVRALEPGEVDPTPNPTEEPTQEPTGEPTQEPTQQPTPGPSAPPVDDVYSTPGFHNHNGRWWYTACEPYSQTIRCTTQIWATTTVHEDGRFTSTDRWVFNNLTYLPQMTRAAWGTNPLANAGEWTAADGRQWRTECDTARTGRNGCRSWVQADVVAATQGDDGAWSFHIARGEWVFNNIVRFRS